MDHLKALIDQFGRWKPLIDYIRRIESYRSTDESICLENAKAILESIAKEICQERGQPFLATDSTGKLLNLAFGSIGYDKTDVVRQIGSSIANIGLRMGTLRNQIGPTSHGKTMEELEARNVTLNKVSTDFLIHSTELVACTLIELFEVEFPRRSQKEESANYNDNGEFNQFLDDLYGDFNVAEYSYSASEVLFGVDPEAYRTELQAFVRDIRDGNK